MAIRLPRPGRPPRVPTVATRSTQATLFFESLEPRVMLSTLEIIAAGAEGDEQMELLIDGATVATFDNIGGNAYGRVFETYNYQTPQTITADQVRVAFTNDLFDPGVYDRNLRVDAVVIDGVRFESEDPSVFSTGTWKPEDGVVPGFRESEFLHSIGYFQYSAGSTALHQIMILAAGTTNDENMQLLIDGQVVRQWNGVGGDANARVFESYTYDSSTPISPDQVRVRFTNDFFQPPIDRNLKIDLISIDGVVFQTEDPSVFSTGTWKPEDGITPGFRESEVLHGVGYFQYAALTNQPGVIALETSIINVDEGDSSAAIRVLRTNGTDGQVTVDYRTIDGSASAGQDYIERSGTLTFADGVAQQTINVPLLDDGILETNETFTLTIDNVTGGATLLVPRTATITISDNEFDPPDFADFSDVSSLTLNGMAVADNGRLRLATAFAFQKGSAFYNAALPVDAATSFQASFAFTLNSGQGSGGADGLAFVLQNSAAGAGAIGADGEAIGYGGVGNSLAIEFDTYKNPFDINDNHVSILRDGDYINPLRTTTSPLDLNSSEFRFVWVDYNGPQNEMAIYISAMATKPNQPILVETVDLFSIVGSQAWLGFTAATGGLYNNHALVNWQMNLDVPPPVDPPDPGNLAAITVASGFASPTAIEWTPDGQNMYVSQQDGVVYTVRNGTRLATPFINISAHVNGTRDRGLLDIAVHPNFANNPYVYLLYTYDPPEVFDYTNHPLAGPDQNGNRAGRLTRVTADAATNYTTAVPGTEVILLGSNSTWDNFNGFVNSTVNFAEPPAGILPGGENLRDFIASDSESHTVGGVEFAPDGALIVSIGDGTSYNQVDPRTVRVQDIDNLSGKILRIDPITGDGLSDNPFFNGDVGANRSKVYQYGLRNPFRLTVDQTTGQIFIGDVGWGTWEEVNSAGPGANFGWPYYEGGNGVNIRTPGYQFLPEAQAFYASGQTATPAIFALNHAASGINAIVMGDISSGSAYPSQFQGDLFFNDLGQGIVRNINFDAGGDVESVDTFFDSPGILVMINEGPDGLLYYVDIVSGLVGRWEFI